MYTEMMKNLINYGTDCHCYDAGDNTVGKVYKNPKMAAFAFKMHQVALDWGIAPDLIGLQDTCYYCEKVQTLVELGLWMRFRECDSDYNELTEVIEEAFGHGYYDLYGNNLALNKHGDIILIDFGLVGWEHTRMARVIASEVGMSDKLHKQVYCY